MFNLEFKPKRVAISTELINNLIPKTKRKMHQGQENGFV